MRRRNLSGFVLLAFTSLLIVSACKSKKKVAAITNPNVVTEKTKPSQEHSLSQKDLKGKEAVEQAKLDAMKSDTYKARLTQYFDEIAASGNITSANNSINEALGLFASPGTPVLVVISEEGGQKDYDRPTTIRAYLNYVKDQKKNNNRVESIKMDDSGKITEVELRKLN
ncbi:hypothetical protein WSM22_35240 [Cytophagales bacterium WSM2-2]|nr:hypothetical protein WSM22_35240 [Cytophagales bacterium WSM2-2]